MRDKICLQLVSGEGPLFDVPPAAFGRFRVLHQIGAGTSGPVFRGIDPLSDTPVAIKVFRSALARERAEAVNAALVDLARTIPAHPATTHVIEAGLAGDEPYLVTSIADGDSLDVALRRFGAAALVDVVPRLAALADALDTAAAHGVVHGSLHPRDILLSDTETTMVGIGLAGALLKAGAAQPERPAYTAPEQLHGAPSAAADQFALASIAFEWITGRLPVRAADGTVDVPAWPGVDHGSLARAFGRALAPNSADRFATARAFVDALSASVLGADASEAAAGERSPRKWNRGPVPSLLFVDDDAPAEPQLSPLVNVDRAETDVDRLADDLHLDDRGGESDAPAEDADAVQPVSWRGDATFAAPPASAGFGVMTLLMTAVVALALGFGMGYGVRGWRLPAAPAEALATDTASAPKVAPASPSAAVEVPSPTVGPSTDAPAAAPRPPAPAAVAPSPKTAAPTPAAASAAPGRLLLRSTPAGAAVTIDGQRRGSTPLTLRGLALGTMAVTLERPGFATEQRRVALTSARPSRTLEVNLAPVAAATPPRLPPGRPAAASTGSLSVESRPAGARVLVDGRVVGVTPLTLDALTPGTYAVRLELSGYQPLTTTVRVIAGERARAAASLIGAQEQE